MQDEFAQLVECQKFKDLPACNCAICSKEITRAALRLIWLLDDPASPAELTGIYGAPRPVVTATAQGKVLLVQYPVCNACAPECKKCELPIETDEVVEARRRISNLTGRDVKGFAGCWHFHWGQMPLVKAIKRLFKHSPPSTHRSAVSEHVSGTPELSEKEPELSEKETAQIMERMANILGSSLRGKLTLQQQIFALQSLSDEYGLGMDLEAALDAKGLVKKAPTSPRRVDYMRAILLHALETRRTGDITNLSRDAPTPVEAEHQRVQEKTLRSRIERANATLLESLLRELDESEQDAAQIEAIVRDNNPQFRKFQAIFAKPKISDKFSHGFPFHELAALLVESGWDVSSIENGLLVRDIVGQNDFETVIKAECPDSRDFLDRPIRAIITIKTKLPKDTIELIGRPETISKLNKLATLGSLFSSGKEYYVGSRFSLYEGDSRSVISLYKSLSGASITCSLASVMEAMKRGVAGGGNPSTSSCWTQADFETVRSQLSQVSVCTLGECSLTAEFGLREGHVSAAAGHRHTALWQLLTDVPHPNFGLGLHCLLTMPYRFDTEFQAAEAANDFNRMEMESGDLPPHMGAWRIGDDRRSLVYVSFLPNTLHHYRGIALNFSIWALHRAQLSDAMMQLRALQ